MTSQQPLGSLNSYSETPQTSLEVPSTSQTSDSTDVYTGGYCFHPLHATTNSNAVVKSNVLGPVASTTPLSRNNSDSFVTIVVYAPPGTEVNVNTSYGSTTFVVNKQQVIEKRQMVHPRSVGDPPPN